MSRLSGATGIPVVTTCTAHLVDGDPRRLDDPAAVHACALAVVEVLGLHPVGDVSHQFDPQGVSVAVLLAESHIAVHSWPEHRGGYLTFTCCRPFDRDVAERVTRRLAAEHLGARVDAFVYAAER